MCNLHQMLAVLVLWLTGGEYFWVMSLWWRVHTFSRITGTTDSTMGQQWVEKLLQVEYWAWEETSVPWHNPRILTCLQDAWLCSTDPKPAYNDLYRTRCSSSLHKMDVHPIQPKEMELLHTHIHKDIRLPLQIWVFISSFQLTSNFGNSCIIRESLSWKFCWVYFTLRM